MLRLMDALEESQWTSQRQLSRRAGISLGLTNLLLERMANKAWVKLTGISGSRMIYALTPTGLSEKTRKARDWVRQTYRYIAETRQFLIEELHRRGVPRPRVACYGAPEWVELVRDAVREFGGRLVVVVDETAVGERAGLRIWKPERLSRLKVDHVVLLKRPPRGVQVTLKKASSSMIDLT